MGELGDAAKRLSAQRGPAASPSGGSGELRQAAARLAGKPMVVPGEVPGSEINPTRFTKAAVGSIADAGVRAAKAGGSPDQAMVAREKEILSHVPQPPPDEMGVLESLAYVGAPRVIGGENSNRPSLFDLYGQAPTIGTDVRFLVADPVGVLDHLATERNRRATETASGLYDFLIAPPGWDDAEALQKAGEAGIVPTIQHALGTSPPGRILGAMMGSPQREGDDESLNELLRGIGEAEVMIDEKPVRLESTPMRTMRLLSTPAVPVLQALSHSIMDQSPIDLTAGKLEGVAKALTPDALGLNPYIDQFSDVATAQFNNVGAPVLGAARDALRQAEAAKPELMQSPFGPAFDSVWYEGNEGNKPTRSTAEAVKEAAVSPLLAAKDIGDGGLRWKSNWTNPALKPVGDYLVRQSELAYQGYGVTDMAVAAAKGKGYDRGTSVATMAGLLGLGIDTLGNLEAPLIGGAKLAGGLGRAASTGARLAKAGSKVEGAARAAGSWLRHGDMIPYGVIRGDDIITRMVDNGGDFDRALADAPPEIQQAVADIRAHEGFEKDWSLRDALWNDKDESAWQASAKEADVQERLQEAVQSATPEQDLSFLPDDPAVREQYLALKDVFEKTGGTGPDYDFQVGLYNTAYKDWLERTQDAARLQIPQVDPTAMQRAAQDAGATQRLAGKLSPTDQRQVQAMAFQGPQAQAAKVSQLADQRASVREGYRTTEQAKANTPVADVSALPLAEQAPAAVAGDLVQALRDNPNSPHAAVMATAPQGVTAKSVSEYRATTKRPVRWWDKPAIRLAEPDAPDVTGPKYVIQNPKTGERLPVQSLPEAYRTLTRGSQGRPPHLFDELVVEGSDRPLASWHTGKKGTAGAIRIDPLGPAPGERRVLVGGAQAKLPKGRVTRLLQEFGEDTEGSVALGRGAQIAGAAAEGFGYKPVDIKGLPPHLQPGAELLRDASKLAMRRMLGDDRLVGVGDTGILVTPREHERITAQLAKDSRKMQGLLPRKAKGGTGALDLPDPEGLRRLAREWGYSGETSHWEDGVTTGELRALVKERTRRLAGRGARERYIVSRSRWFHQQLSDWAVKAAEKDPGEHPVATRTGRALKALFRFDSLDQAPAHVRGRVEKVTNTVTETGAEMLRELRRQRLEDKRSGIGRSDTERLFDQLDGTWNPVTDSERALLGQIDNLGQTLNEATARIRAATKADAAHTNAAANRVVGMAQEQGRGGVQDAVDNGRQARALAKEDAFAKAKQRVQELELERDALLEALIEEGAVHKGRKTAEARAGREVVKARAKKIRAEYRTKIAAEREATSSAVLEQAKAEAEAAVAVARNERDTLLAELYSNRDEALAGMSERGRAQIAQLQDAAVYALRDKVINEHRGVLDPAEMRALTSRSPARVAEGLDMVHARRMREHNENVKQLLGNYLPFVDEEVVQAWRQSLPKGTVDKLYNDVVHGTGDGNRLVNDLLNKHPMEAQQRPKVATNEQFALGFVSRLKADAALRDGLVDMMERELGLPADSPLIPAIKQLLTPAPQDADGTVRWRGDEDVLNQASLYMRRFGLRPGVGHDPLVKVPGTNTMVPSTVAQMFDAAKRSGIVDLKDLKKTESVLQAALALQKQSVLGGYLLPRPAKDLGNFINAHFQIYRASGMEGLAGAYATMGKHPDLVSALVARSSRFNDGALGRRIGYREGLDGRLFYTKGGEVYTLRELEKLSAELGINTSNARATSARQLADDLRQEADFDKTRNVFLRGYDKTFSPKSWWNQVLVEIPHVMESSFRHGVFLDELFEGKSPTEAAQAARNALYDMNKMSPWEKQVAKKSVWFYAFARKSLDQNMSMLWNNPHRAIPMAKFLSQQHDAWGYSPMMQTDKSSEDFLKLVLYRQFEHLDTPQGNIDPRYIGKEWTVQFDDMGSALLLAYDLANISPIPLTFAAPREPLFNQQVGSRTKGESMQKLVGQMAPNLTLPIEAWYGRDIETGRDITGPENAAIPRILMAFPLTRMAVQRAFGAGLVTPKEGSAQAGRVGPGEMYWAAGAAPGLSPNDAKAAQMAWYVFSQGLGMQSNLLTRAPKPWANETAMEQILSGTSTASKIVSDEQARIRARDELVERAVKDEDKAIRERTGE